MTLINLNSVELSLTELCNRTCSFCPRHDASIYPNRNLNMSIDTVTRIRDQLLINNYKEEVILCGYGEPLLHPDILAISKILSVFNLKIITNGDVLIRHNNSVSADALLGAGVSNIVISDYDNKNQYQYLADTYKQITIRNRYDDGTDRYKEYNFTNRGGSMWKIKNPIKNPCYIPTYNITIDWDGSVLPCSMDWTKIDIYGNVNESTLYDIWHGYAFSTLRKQLLKGNRDIAAVCKVCNINGQLHGSDAAESWNLIYKEL
jgi:MoaA/NifB/PqqE/SkfB family radical SAM enzyme